MKNSLFVWGLVLLVGFFLSYWLAVQGYSAAWIWIAWAVIFNVANYFMLKSMKKMSKSMRAVWTQAHIFGLIVTLVVALDIITLNFAFLMSLWFLLIGASLFAGGHETKDSLAIASSLILLFSSVFTLAFGNSYFLAGSLILGLLTVLSGIFTKN